VGFCPYFNFFDGQVVVIDPCQADSERCYQVCPVTGTPEALTAAHEGEGIGPIGEIVMSRAARANVRDTSQYGGVVTTLMTYALEKGRIESAILTTQGDAFSPQGWEARDTEAITQCAGSRYTASGSLSVLNRALKEGRRNLGVVGLPCQMTALANMTESWAEPEGLDERIMIKIGLFCTWALDYRNLNEFLEGEGVKGPFLKCDIPPPPAEIFQVQAQEGWREFPLSKIRPYVQKGCLLCEDMTAEKSDISVGAVEGLDEWNTVILRTERGSRLFKHAVKDGWIETETLPLENLDHLKEAARNKRARGKGKKND
jgi:coenzyme F420 hydrogenase subunit beta